MLFRSTPVKIRSRRQIIKKTPRKDIENKLNFSAENSSSVAEVKSLEEANTVMQKLHTELEKTKKQLQNQEYKSLKLSGEVENLKSKVLSYENLINEPSMFTYLCGLSTGQFDIIFECLEPYLHLIPYPNNDKVSTKPFSFNTQIFIT